MTDINIRIFAGGDKNTLHWCADSFYNTNQDKGELMKKITLLSAIFGLFFVGTASAADVTLYYSPTCPHCHHAREFFVNRVVYEYPDLRIVQVNVMDQANQEKFSEVLKKCEYTSGGVPVITVGDKCFQGYADFMQQELRDAVEVDMTEDQKKAAAENKRALDENADDFRSKHPARAGAVTEYNAAALAAAEHEAQKKTEAAAASPVYFYALLIVLVAALAFVLVRKDRKKK